MVNLDVVQKMKSLRCIWLRKGLGAHIYRGNGSIWAKLRFSSHALPKVLSKGFSMCKSKHPQAVYVFYDMKFLSADETYKCFKECLRERV